MARKPFVPFKRKMSYSSSQEVSTADCNKTIPNTYHMIIYAAQRARELAHGATPMVECDNKPVVTAMREIAAGKIKE